jgi:transcriptional regulator with XRE-family HTH domain
MDNNSFWGRVKPLLKAHKMTQKQLAEYMGISINTLQSWIKYDRVPDSSTAYEMAIVLGVTLNYLLGGREANIADWRVKELTAREAAARILELTEQIEKETKKLRPLMKILTNKDHLPV